MVDFSIFRAEAKSAKSAKINPLKVEDSFVLPKNQPQPPYNQAERIR